jgi:hypothetical protein
MCSVVPATMLDASSVLSSTSWRPLKISRICFTSMPSFSCSSVFTCSTCCHSHHSKWRQAVTLSVRMTARPEAGGRMTARPEAGGRMTAMIHALSATPPRRTAPCAPSASARARTNTRWQPKPRFHPTHTSYTHRAHHTPIIKSTLTWICMPPRSRSTRCSVLSFWML